MTHRHPQTGRFLPSKWTKIRYVAEVALGYILGIGLGIIGTLLVTGCTITMQVERPPQEDMPTCEGIDALACSLGLDPDECRCSKT